MRLLRMFFVAILLAIGLPGVSFATETSGTTITPARHSVQPTGRNVYLTHNDCEVARLTGNISGYGPSTAAIRSAEVGNKRAGLVARFSDQTLSAMRARGESTQGCVLEDTSVYSDGHGHSHATGQTLRGRFWVVKNLEDLYDGKDGKLYDWWCVNLIPSFPQPREDAPTSRVDVPATDVTVRVEEPAPRHVYQRVPVIVHHVPQVTEVWDPPVVTRRSGRVDITAPTEEVIYEEDCGCQEEPAEPVRDTYTRREWHRCGDRIGDTVADHDGYYLVTYER